MGASFIHRGSEGQPGKIGAASEPTPASMYSLKASRRRRLGVENCSRAPRVLSHGICFGQWDNSKHDASWGLKDACALATCFRFCYAWEPCDHCYVNKPGPDCCDKRYMAKSSLLPQLNCANYQTREWGHPRSSMPSQATRGPQGSDGPVQPRTIRLMHKITRNNKCLLVKLPSLGWFVIPKANRHSKVRNGD